MGIATFKSRPVAFKQAANNVIRQRRLLYVVHYNVDRGTFYVQLDDESQAVLRYKTDGKVLDMQSVTVPAKYKSQGLARLLAETAFTYAIVNNYYMYLRYEYLQKYYRTVKNPDLEERVVGPPHILNGLDSASSDSNVILMSCQSLKILSSNDSVQGFQFRTTTLNLIICLKII